MHSEQCYIWQGLAMQSVLPPVPLRRNRKFPRPFWQRSFRNFPLQVSFTLRAARGGVTLAREPKDITLLEVVEAIDGPIQLNECMQSNGVCSFEDTCPIRTVWCAAQDELVRRLRSTNFADLMAPML